MLKVKAGKLDKLGLLFERYNRKLFRYFYRLTYRRDISEDLVQGVFERILKYRHTYDDSDAFSTWIYRIARNLHADHYRRNGNERPGKAVDFDRVAAHGDMFPAEEDEDPDIKWLQQAIATLDPVKRETLILSRYQGFRYKEIAAIMDCTESAVKVRIYRTLNELRTSINELRNNNHHE